MSAPQQGPPVPGPPPGARPTGAAAPNSAAPAGPGAGAAPAPVSGDSRLAAPLAVLDTLSGRPLCDHVEVYQQLHATLAAALGEIDGG